MKSMKFYFSGALILALASISSVSAKGILVKFLPNPSSDSVSRYFVNRSLTAGSAGSEIGEISVGLENDTLRFPDLTAEKGVAYYYSIKAAGPDGLESGLSLQTAVATPRLSLPDTLTAATGQPFVAFRLAPGSHPLSGRERLSVRTLETDRFAATWDEASGTVRISDRRGLPISGPVILAASYYGKFQDVDTAYVAIATGAYTSDLAERSLPPIQAGKGGFPNLRLANVAPGSILRIITPEGKIVFQKVFHQPQELFEWDGNGEQGDRAGSIIYHYILQERRGKRISSGTFRPRRR